MDQFIGEEVVIDVEALFVYVGKLTDVAEKTITLVDADVHDLRDSNTTRERYVLDTKTDGVRSNRKKVLISRPQILSLSLLKDVMD